jgi:hypothetical protein
MMEIKDYKELINYLDEWEKDITIHLKYVTNIGARATLCVTLSRMIEYKERIKKECEKQCQLEQQA